MGGIFEFGDIGGIVVENVVVNGIGVFVELLVVGLENEVLISFENGVEKMDGEVGIVVEFFGFVIVGFWKVVDVFLNVFIEIFLVIM